MAVWTIRRRQLPRTPVHTVHTRHARHRSPCACEAWVGLETHTIRSPYHGAAAMSRTCFRFDIFRRWKHLPDTSCTALTHDTTAQRAHPKCASSIEPMPPSATAKAVGIATALRLQRARQLPACGAQAAASSCGSPPAASRGLPTHPEAHSVVAYMIDGLRAKGLISWQRKVAKWWSVDLTTAPTCSADEPIRKAADSSKTLVRSSSRELCGPWHAALDVRSGPGAAQLTRTTSRGLARSRTVASGTMPGRPEVRFVSVRERVKPYPH